MKTALKLLILVPVGVLIVAFALANRAPATVSFDAFGLAPGIEATAPLFVTLFAVLMLGVAIGGIATWLGQHRHRRAARRNGAEAARLRSELAELRPEPDMLRIRAVAGGLS